MSKRRTTQLYFFDHDLRTPVRCSQLYVYDRAGGLLDDRFGAPRKAKSCRVEIDGGAPPPADWPDVVRVEIRPWLLMSQESGQAMKLAIGKDDVCVVPVDGLADLVGVSPTRQVELRRAGARESDWIHCPDRSFEAPAGGVDGHFLRVRRSQRMICTITVVELARSLRWIGCRFVPIEVPVSDAGDGIPYLDAPPPPTT